MATKTLINMPHHEADSSVIISNSDKPSVDHFSGSLGNNTSPVNHLSTNHFTYAMGETYAQVLANESPSNQNKILSSSSPIHEEDDSSVHLFKDCLEGASTNMHLHPLSNIPVTISATENTNSLLTPIISDQLLQEEPLLHTLSKENATQTGGGGIIKRFFWKKQLKKEISNEKVMPMENTTINDEGSTGQENNDRDADVKIILENEEKELEVAKNTNQNLSGKGFKQQKHFVFGIKGGNVFYLRNKMNAYHTVEGDDTINNRNQKGEIRGHAKTGCENMEDDEICESYYTDKVKGNKEEKCAKKFTLKKGSNTDEVKKSSNILIPRFGGTKQLYVIWNGKKKGNDDTNDGGNIQTNNATTPIHQNMEKLKNTRLPASYQIPMEQIFMEPNNYRSYDFVWNTSKAIFTFVSLFLYRIFSLLIAIPLALIWAILMSVTCVLNVWLIGPIIGFFVIWMELIQRVLSSVYKTFITPLIEAFVVGKSVSTIKTACCNHTCLKNGNSPYVLNFEEKNGNAHMTNGTENVNGNQEGTDEKMYPEIVSKLV